MKNSSYFDTALESIAAKQSTAEPPVRVMRYAAEKKKVIKAAK